jgi:hypothetical protein
MRQEVREPTTRHQSRMQSLVSVMTVVFWASVALMVVFVALNLAVPALSNERTFNLLSGAVLVLIMISSAFLFGKSGAPTAKKCAEFFERVVTSRWKVDTIGHPERGSTSLPWDSPSSSRGSSCPTCSYPSERPGLSPSPYFSNSFSLIITS